MNSSKPFDPPRVPKGELQYPDRIHGWLNELDINSTEGEVTKSELSGDFQPGNELPVTPLRRLETESATHQEISPTDTTFSGYSIFDAPEHKKLHFGSPIAKCHGCDDLSDISSVDDGGNWNWKAIPSKEQAIGPPAGPIFVPPPSSSSASAKSYDPLSEVDRESSIEIQGPVLPFPTVAPCQDSNKPQPVWITSCLQCTLAGLPCSRTYPYCSRCKRNNHAEACLLQRRCFGSEVLHSSRTKGCKAPTLLKVRGEDEALWKRKVELANELCGKWSAEQEKKNWVLPDINSPRGGWRRRRDGFQGKKMLYPGEGIGRLSFRELFVDMNA